MIIAGTSRTEVWGYNNQRNPIHPDDRYPRLQIGPLIGDRTIDAITPETLDALYATLARCRHHCTPHSPHATAHSPQKPHDPRHTCRPLAAASIRKVHYLISGAYRTARRWQWITTNPTALANPPSKPRPHPQPPRPTELTRILTHLWTEPDPLLGVLTWTAITTGPRRGELSALRENDFDTHRQVLHIHTSIAHDGPNLIEKDTKLHQHRRVSLDPDTTTLIAAYLNHRRHHAAAHGITLVPNAFLFSSAPDGSTCIAPNTLSQRFRRLTTRLGIRTTLHKLRHYNATELILAGVNLRTVAGRLGHSDAAMTLNSYTAWINEADQRASALLANRLPLRLTVAPQPPPPTSPYQAIAHDLRTAITNGTYPPGTHLPNLHTLAAHYHVAPSTAHRAITQLTHDNLIHTTPGHPTTITNNPPTTTNTHPPTHTNPHTHPNTYPPTTPPPHTTLTPTTSPHRRPPPQRTHPKTETTQMIYYGLSNIPLSDRESISENFLNVDATLAHRPLRVRSPSHSHPDHASHTSPARRRPLLLIPDDIAMREPRKPHADDLGKLIPYLATRSPNLKGNKAEQARRTRRRKPALTASSITFSYHRPAAEAY
ncbi:hypothetical protein ALI144C_02500 [Actinosynnema sp. ALI-1.44]|uniref:site-specific integrase n=1 Tax=Actinosynnema sp. ALI-1.44 TaxID=1933779 RepID=UPI00097BF4CE|nr:site-specific integrase [Actinosynnema sp. ALI-1.44]ONI90573.1 hypothetical protein ALI144C_02500 [Actinosynnema sp. ALI-1.44]